MLPEVAVAIISAGRPANVPAMLDLCEGLPTPTWYVRPEDADAYAAAGAVVHPTEGGLIGARNAALGGAFARRLPCLQLDDDLRRIKVLDERGGTARPAGLPEAVELIWSAMLQHRARLGGASPTGNAYFTHRPVQTAHFVIASLCLVRPSSPRFDAAMRLKEDYDFTCQHLAAYGAVARVDRVLADFVHYSNAGGCQDYRGPGLEAEAVGHLLGKWPGVFRDNPKRPNEVLMDGKRVRPAVSRA